MGILLIAGLIAGGFFLLRGKSFAPTAKVSTNAALKNLIKKSPIVRASIANMIKSSPSSGPGSIIGIFLRGGTIKVKRIIK